MQLYKKHVSKRFSIKARKIFKHKSIPARKKAIALFLNSKRATLIFLLPTLYLLYIDDIIGASGTEQTDSFLPALGSFKFIIFILFLVELILAIYTKGRDYVLSLICILDVVALVSLIPDIFTFLFGFSLVSLAQLSLVRVSRAARVASRMARLGRVIDVMNCGKRKSM